MVDMYHQTQTMLCDFLKEKNEQKSEYQPFYDFVATEADKLHEAYYDSFQAEVLNLLQRPKQMHRVKQPPHIIRD